MPEAVIVSTARTPIGRANKANILFVAAAGNSAASLKMASLGKRFSASSTTSRSSRSRSSRA